MEIFTLLLFFVLALGFGYSVTFFVRWQRPFYERTMMTLGFGLGVVPVVGVLLNILHVQIYWPIFLALSLLVPAYSLYKNGSAIFSSIKAFASKPRLMKSGIYFLIVLILAIVFFGVYHHGAFSYPYLEDDDPWLHAAGVKYIKEIRTISLPIDVAFSTGRYLEPYPPGFDILMGILHQTNGDVIWTLKFFNVLLISLVGIFFYFFACDFLQSKKKALTAMFVLLVIPCFLSHFVWASTLAILLFFPALYAVQRIEEDWKWLFPAAVAMAGMIMTQMSNPFIFGILLLVFVIVRSISTKQILWKHLLAGVIAVIISFSLFWVPAVMKFGLEDTAGKNSITIGNLSSITTKASGGGLLYSWNDFIFAQKQNKMDNPIGVGMVISFILLFSLLVITYGWFRHHKKILSKENDWQIISVIWLLIAFAGIHGNRLPFPMLMPHRWWSIFAIPVAIICVEGFFALGKLSERFKIHRFFVYAAILIGVLITSGYPKYVVETSMWPPGVNWGSMEELQGYLSYVQPLPYNTKVFPICSDEFKVLAFDKLAEPWDPTYAQFKETVFGKSSEQLHSWLKLRQYEYVTMDSYCLRTHDINATNDELAKIGNATYFSFVNSNKGFFLFKVL
jgi:hypothetical protein